MGEPARDPGIVPFPSRTVPDDLAIARRLAAVREYGLISILELSQELSDSPDPFQLADLALFNLMGQLRTSRASLWLIAGENSGDVPVLMRCHGFQSAWARSLGFTFGSAIVEALRSRPAGVSAMQSREFAGEEFAQSLVDAGVQVVAPILSRGECIGLFAVGPRVDGQPFEDIDLRILESSLTMVGTALENNRLYLRLVEQQRQLRRTRQDLEELDSMKAEFLRNVNHELRTPLTVTLAYLDILSEQKVSEEEQAAFLEVARSQSRRLNQLMEKLLDFTDITTENAALSLKPLDIVALCQAFHEDRRPGIAAGLRELVLEDPRGKVFGVGDPRRVEDILEVLVENASKFTPLGTVIRMTAETAILEGKPWAVIRVSDNGPGVPADKQEKIFTSFHQGDGSTTREQGGLGMGLSYGRSLAERMRGSLTVSNLPEGGAEFVLTLPVGSEAD